MAGFWQSAQAGKGVSLIETLVALFILVLGITAALSLVGYVSNITAATKYKIIATNLAREGIEVVRNIRDSNWVFYGSGGARDHWDDWEPSWRQSKSSSPPVAGTTRTYKLVLQTSLPDPGVTDPALAYKLVPLTNVSNDDEARVYLRKGGAGLPEDATLYTQAEGEGEPTIFARRLTISYPVPVAGGDNIVEVTSRINWQEHGRPRQISLATKLTDWWQRSDHN